MAKLKIVMGKFRGQMSSVWGEPMYLEKKAFEKLDAALVEADGSSDETFIPDAKDADALLIHGGGVNVNRKVIESLEKCKIIALPTVGFDNIDIEAASEKGIWVTNTPDVFIEEVADHTMTLLLGCWRRIIVQDQLVI